ncbi:MAG TPA: transglycosylase domain-containing protein [Acidimicrobiales bacterium]|nr:transglycosylase domain-containing protein [Acidimicrobiales bacterium]
MESPFLARTALVTIVFAALAPVLVAGLVLLALVTVPVPDELPPARAPGGSQISRVYDASGQEIGQFTEFEQNRPVEPQDIPDVLKKAVVAAEDKNFYRHGGIDFAATLRALLADIRGQEIVQGGSTITQQYVKSAYTGGERTIARKIREGVLARQLSRSSEKEEILFKYLSSIYLGEGAYGVGAASETYFRKPVNDLTLSEAALLAGLIPAPSRLEPRGNQGAAEAKRRHVLDRMLELGFISSDEHAKASQERVWLAANGPLTDRPATNVYPARPQFTKFPYFVDYVRRYLEDKIGRDAVYRGGLEIRTTLDPELQAAAEGATAEGLAGVDPAIEMALVSVEPQTGYVKALVGGRDFSAPDGQVNLALGKCAFPPAEVKDRVDVPATCWDDEAVRVEGGGTGRQPGSSWKPFVLAAAFAKGITDDRVYSAPSQYRIPGCTGDRGCVIENYEGGGGGRVSLRRATHNSYNTVYAQLVLDVGVPEVGEMAKKLGITSAWVANPEVHGPSYALGAQEVSPLDMASAFGVFANGGMRVEPTPVQWVKDPDGDFIEDNRRPEPRRVLAQIIADNVTDVLKGVITEGTGTRADIGRPAAGKTGTAQEWRDAWFTGYTPTLSTSVWIGNKQRPTPLLNVKGVARVTGGSIPAETWKLFMSEALAEVPPTDFSVPLPLQSTSTTVFTPTAPPFSAFSEESTTTFFDPGGPTTTFDPDAPATTPTSDPFAAATTTSTTALPTTTTTTTRPRPCGGLLQPRC